MNLAALTPDQQRALLDLLMLGMYADRHLATVEDARMQRFLAALRLPSEAEARRQFDASVARVREAAGSPEAARRLIATAAAAFPAQPSRLEVLAELTCLLGSDGQVPEPERRYLELAEEVLMR